jgi:hypothetical protein
MTWSIDSAVANVRELLQDKQVPYRNATVEIVGVLNIALVEARKLRPDLYLPELASYEPSFFIEADLGLEPPTAFPIDPMYFAAIVEYIVGYISMEDDEFAVGGRAVTLLNRFAQKLVGKGA